MKSQADRSSGLSSAFTIFHDFVHQGPVCNAIKDSEYSLLISGFVCIDIVQGYWKLRTLNLFSVDPKKSELNSDGHRLASTVTLHTAPLRSTENGKE